MRKKRQKPEPAAPESRTQECFETWAIVEVFGHNTYIGLVTEAAIGGCNFVRVDVPELPAIGKDYPSSPAFTKFLGQGAIYAITPVSKEAALEAAVRLRAKPVTVYIPRDRQIEEARDDY